MSEVEMNYMTYDNMRLALDFFAFKGWLNLVTVEDINNNITELIEDHRKIAELGIKWVDKK